MASRFFQSLRRINLSANERHYWLNYVEFILRTLTKNAQYDDLRYDAPSLNDWLKFIGRANGSSHSSNRLATNYGTRSSVANQWNFKTKNTSEHSKYAYFPPLKQSAISKLLSPDCIRSPRNTDKQLRLWERWSSPTHMLAFEADHTLRVPPHLIVCVHFYEN